MNETLTINDSFKHFNNIKVPIIILEVESGDIVECNVAASDYFGYTYQTLCSLNIEDITTLSFEIFYEKSKMLKLRHLKFWHLDKIKSADGNRQVEMYADFFSDDNKEYISLTIYDSILTSKMFSINLQNKVHLDSVFHNFPEAVVILDTNFKVHAINEEFTNLFQYDIDAIKDKDLGVVLCQPQLYDDVHSLREKILTGQKVNEQLQRQRQDGELVHVELISFPLMTNDKISGICCIYYDKTENRKQQIQLRNLTYKDPLTGFFNNKFFIENVRNEILKKEDNDAKEQMAILVLNINELKEMNNILGRKMGELLFKQAADNLRKVINNQYIIARIADAELGIMLPTITSKNEIYTLTQQIINVFMSNYDISKIKLRLTANIGVAIYPEDGRDFQTLLRSAEIALKKAMSLKQNSTVEFKQRYDEEYQEEFWLKKHLSDALTNDELYLEYQPIMDISKNKMIGVEALVRWHHPNKGLIPPGRFIPIAEESTNILEIGEWVLLQSCLQCKRWNDMGYQSLKVSVNVSIIQLQDPKFSSIVEEMVLKTGILPAHLQLEITESIFTHDYGPIKDTIQRISKLGVKFSIDDFGTGYSSLVQLLEFDVDNIKLDRSLIKEVHKSAAKEKVVKAMITLAESLNISLISEGIETKEELDFIAQHQNVFVQGFIFSKPISTQKIEQILQSQGD